MSPYEITDIAERLDALRSSLENTSQQSDISVERPHLIAVSKRQPDEKIRDALDAGHRLFGENMVQEAQARWSALKSHYSELELHLIGPLQSNKTKEAVSLFDVIHTIDRPKIADAIRREMDKQNRQIRCFIQVNTGEEEQKSGVYPKELPELLKHCQSTGLNIEGLMCIPPADSVAAPHFALLKKLADKHNLKELSMGMSGDYETATKLGATYVRVGTGVFGKREA